MNVFSFRDVLLSTEELQFVVEKVLRLLSKLDLQEMPPLVYQLLLLSAKGSKRTILEGVITVFNDLDQKLMQEAKNDDSIDLDDSTIPKEQLRQVEGTIILHIVFAIKFDQDLGRELVKVQESSVTLNGCTAGGHKQIFMPFQCRSPLVCVQNT
ncbi:hypothetical protein AB205_0177600 [Aquarana catesbeiana]|uniref:FANCI solenoid 1 domain-containing protein n=1 Tax=Aquarana catesbeiana TaxID=8400 RepID=A0A2G9S177_AQUCT|nr:hypothetical protein AB205_0177600 [Aquarana catesbeiana]